MKEWVEKSKNDIIFCRNFNRHAPDQFADQRWLIDNSAKNKYLFYIKWWVG